MEFFQQLADKLADRQELRLNVKKVGTEIVLMIVPDYKGDGKVLHMTGEPVEVDIEFFSELEKSRSKDKAKFQATVTEGSDEDKDGQDDDADDKKAVTNKKSSSKKKPVKKAATKKAKSTQGLSKGGKMVNSKKDEKILSEKIANENKKKKKNGKSDSAAVGETTKETAEVKETGPTKEDQFKTLMDQAKQDFDARKYTEAREGYKMALDLFPNNKSAEKEFNNADKWVKALERMKAGS